MAFQHHTPSGDRVAVSPLDDGIWIKTTPNGCEIPGGRVAELIAELQATRQPTGQPEVLVEATRYSVSVLPRDDINVRTYALYVERRRDGWGITDGSAWVVSLHGHWSLNYDAAITRPDLDDALAIARRLAPEYRVNGITATEAYHRTHPDA
ncbi:hypothetical protein ACFU8I_00545 [Streptomyces sp. NPDC057540]|uniref:hypothetical protein n=1 Tax=Streptomyces sp. NPDC057540 TaxID=3346160 RepID=UPI0036767235